MKFERIAIVNRGEPAVRLINAAAEYGRETGTALRTIALHTDPDRQALFVREADESFAMGPAHRTDKSGRREVAYLDYELLEEALVATRADAAWVGWGFVAEHPEFAELCARLGVVFIGPDAHVMRRLGDKITSKKIAEGAGVPVASWSNGAVESATEASAHAGRLGYPVLLKATAGGGGRGIRRVGQPDEMAAAFAAAQAESFGAFGNGTLFVESLVSGARHIEVQIVGDESGTVWSIGVRDCTVQRRNQKIIEEAPSAVLTRRQDRDIKEAAVRLGQAAGYQGAGTVEFLYDVESGKFYFMEVNARLQVEHPITEATTGIDLVKLQLHVAAGGLLEGEPPATFGHAIEARINAEDPERGFAPAPGRIDLLRMPAGPGVRVDSGVEEGDEIPAEFDSMIAKVIAYGATRAEAVSRLDRALSQMRALIRDGTSNKGFIQQLLRHPDFQSNHIDTAWVDRLTVGTPDPGSPRAAVALIAAAITAYEELELVELDSFKASAAQGRPDVDDAVGQTVELRFRGQRYELTVGQVGPDSYRIVLDDAIVLADVERLGRAGMRISTGSTQSWRVLAAVHRGIHSVEVDGTTFRIAHDEGGIIRSPSPAVVMKLLVSLGQKVAAGDRLAVIEAMKMETTIVAEFAGTVRQISVHENTQVGTGTPLMTIDLATGPEDISTAGRVDLTASAERLPTGHGACVHYLDDLRRMILGWDVTKARLENYEGPAGEPCPEGVDETTIRALEDETLLAFVDIVSLFRREPEIDDDRRSSEEHLFVYLRDLSARGAALPDEFLDRLRRTLAHYGVTSLRPSRQLERALVRIARSHKRMTDHVGPLLRVLEDRIQHLSDEEDSIFKELLDRLIFETRGRYRAVNDIAREVYYYSFDEPFLQTVRDQAYADATAAVEYLAAHPDAPDRAAKIEELVSCPQPLKPMLSERFGTASPGLRRTLLEVMTRRYYRIRDLGTFTTATIDGRSFAASAYEHEGRSITVVSTNAALEELAATCQAMNQFLTGLDPTDDVIIDLYVWRPVRAERPEEILGMVQEILHDEFGTLTARLIVLAISSPEVGRGLSGVLNFTFRPDGEGGYREENEYRDLHPMMGKRLELWRLSNFQLLRMPSLEDIYVFHGSAHDNPRDERIFAVGEVRDLSPVRDKKGEVVRLPEFERTFHDLLGAVRRFQAQRSSDRRLPWNRVILYVWPELKLSQREIDGLVQRLAPETVGLGLQKVSVRVRIRNKSGTIKARILEISNPSGGHIKTRLRKPPNHPIRTLDAYHRRVARLRQRGMIHPLELVSMLTPSEGASRTFPPGEFQELDLEGERLVAVDRPRGSNVCNVIVGLITNYTDKHPEGMSRVAILGDPSRGMGNLAEPECRRIIAALALAQERTIPVEWFAVSAGALISMESGTENMDWIAMVLRRLVEFTQLGGEVNVIVAGINVGAQPYWNAEATMLMHTKGILVMTPVSAMVLTGKEALDYSGGISAEDNQGIGGYERIMGPNGQAQYFARDLPQACGILLAHYDHTYVAPGERFPRPLETVDPPERNIEESPHGGEFATVGEVFSEEVNPGRKKPFEIRNVMAAVIDTDRAPLERWFGMQDAETAVVWDAHLGGRPVTLIGFESKKLPRLGAVPADGPIHWTSGTLFPRSSKKVARAINAATGNRPLVILANLSGFDGSPESMRNWQLEYGAEIGRAIVNFQGPIVFCVVSRYHGGAFVVFSKSLNDSMEVAAVEGSRASVIGGAPAAAVVFAREVARRTEDDPRVVAIRRRTEEALGTDRSQWADELVTIRDQVAAEKRGEVADEFDAIHNIHRALEVGSVDHIVAPSKLRQYLVGAVERGMARELERHAEQN
ncbi:MAG: ATP-grasp domain-containing protein [bacterium]|nr:ATP-grasp domain-containing protein [bacterium]